MHAESLSHPSRSRFSGPSGVRPSAGGLVAWGFGLFLSSAAWGQHVGDILLRQEGGRIQTGGIVTGPSGQVFVPGRVFWATFGEFPNFTDDPGFDTSGVPGGSFPNGTVFAFDFLDALHRWDGSDFDAIPVETIRVAKAATSVVTPTGLNEFRTGFAFGQVSSGFLHEHLRFTILTPAGTGVYAMQLRLRVTTGGVQESAPFWIVFNQNVSASEHDAATQYLERLVNPPCPGDLNNDGAVNTADLTRFLSAFGQPTMRLANGDFNGDAAVTTGDLTFFLGRFGGVCP